MKVQVICDWCGKTFERNASYLKGKTHHFCCRECCNHFYNKKMNPDGYADHKDFSRISAHMTALNKEMNPTRMNPATKGKLRQARLGKGKCDGYSKIYGAAAHRVVAEQKLGRPLKKGEVVHHRDGNKYNNSPENLEVFPSQADHARYHNNLRWFISELERIEELEKAEEGGDAE
ncbi:HNH endonuclease [Oribacterium sp. Sow4_G1_1]|jgi:hypothetical protein|uniref:HNH endonuclease n=1 Tax=Oribacterium sp. Sow4_G1_1 TaxID=3438794 RepID=UPI003F9BF108